MRDKIKMENAKMRIIKWERERERERERIPIAIVSYATEKSRVVGFAEKNSRLQYLS